MTEVYITNYFFLHAALLGQGFPHCRKFPTAASRRSLGRVSVPVWPITLSGRLPIVDLVGRYPANYLMGRERTLHRISPGGSSGEYWAMGESLTQQRRVREEGFRIVNLCPGGRRK